MARICTSLCARSREKSGGGGGEKLFLIFHFSFHFTSLSAVAGWSDGLNDGGISRAQQWGSLFIYLIRKERALSL